jgi:glucose dehydrogenase
MAKDSEAWTRGGGPTWRSASYDPELKPRVFGAQVTRNPTYVIDRTNCKPVAANPYVKVNWASRIDMASGRPVLTGIYKDSSPAKKSKSGRSGDKRGADRVQPEFDGVGRE